ncbi:acyl-CoA thioesterase [Pseudonocardia pini]|uniref:acyl-CoA thioesterase n=1 Tax=Pseudonocardia pini TaxID=2758030 RepID=UPI0028AA6C5F|nr:acyl-CoA thioesterase II [Pseudonocardia pini]
MIPELDVDGIPRGQVVLDELIRLLDLEQLDVDLFRGTSPATSPVRVFGGQVAAQALVAAGRTVEPDRFVHSLHSYFIRAGDPRRPIVFRAERIRDGRSFSTRRVLAIQGGEAIFALSASFQLAQEGLVHSVPPRRAVPPPEELDSLGARVLSGAGAGWMERIPRSFDIRLVDEPVWIEDRVATDEPIRAWMKADGTVPDDPLRHVCLLTYISDLTLLGSVVGRHDMSSTSVQLASLDHAMWFHQPFRADEWLLYECWSPAASGGRGLAEGRFFTRDGTLVTSVLQEGLVRLPRE